MESGIPILTEKGLEAVHNLGSGISAKCRNILVQINGERSFDDIRTALRGLDGIEDAISKLVNEKYVALARDCKDLIKGVAAKLVGAKAPILLKKMDEMYAKYGDAACWEHINELEKTARLFYGEVVADNLKTEITKILNETKKQG
ncbi:MAG TPA: hypothetical protein VF903_11845 [Nitrospirota bacterium]